MKRNVAALVSILALVPTTTFGKDEPRRVRVAIDLQAQEPPLASAVTLSVRYPATYAPASSSAQPLREQVHPTLANVVTSVREEKGSLRLVMARGAGFPAGELCTIELVTSEPGQPAVDAFGCRVEAAGSATGPVDGVTCSVRYLD